MDRQYTVRLEKIEKALERWLPENPGSAWASEVFPGLGQYPDESLLRALAAPGKDVPARRDNYPQESLVRILPEAGENLRGPGGAGVFRQPAFQGLFYFF